MNWLCPAPIQIIPWASLGTITFGASILGRLLTVAHTHRSGAIRIISARRVTRTERKIYEEG